jgi:hypothetical protein
MPTEVKQVVTLTNRVLHPNKPLLRVKQILSRANLTLTEVKASKILQTGKRPQTPANHMRSKIRLRLNQTNPPQLRIQY